VVLAENRIREIGTHEELIKLEDGLYRKLHNVQRQIEPISDGLTHP
jgi:ABC-type multidrug transport system fused ATPase/permease subunit